MFLTIVYWFGAKSPTTYGPVATGFSFAQVTGSFTVFQMCSGTMICWSMMVAAGTFGPFRWNVTVLPDELIVSMFCHCPSRSSAGVFLSRSKV